MKKTTSSEKVVITEEGLDGIDRDDIGNLEDSPRLVFIDEECENLMVVNDGGKLTKILTKRRSQTFYNKCCRRAYFFNNHMEYCESVW